MCRSIKRLRERDVMAPGEEIEAAALQFVRKISGYRTPSAANRDVFYAAVAEIAASSSALLQELAERHPEARRHARDATSAKAMSSG